MREHLRQDISDQSRGTLVLSSLQKTNGFDQTIGGMSLYTLEWRASLSVQADVWKINDPVYFWSTFSVMSKEPVGEDLLFGARQATALVKGATVVLVGEASLQKTDNGWRVVGLKVKSSQALNNQRTPAALAEFERKRDSAKAVEQQAQASEVNRAIEMARAADSARLLASAAGTTPAAYRAQMILDLLSLRSAEEKFFAGSNRYAALGELTPTFTSTAGVAAPRVKAGMSSWSATVTHRQLPGVICGVAVAEVNPVGDAAEGEPVCK